MNFYRDKLDSGVFVMFYNILGVLILVMLSTDALDCDIITHLRTSLINFLPIQSLLSALKNPYC